MFGEVCCGHFENTVDPLAALLLYVFSSIDRPSCKLLVFSLWSTLASSIQLGIKDTGSPRHPAVPTSASMPATVVASPPSIGDSVRVATSSTSRIAATSQQLIRDCKKDATKCVNCQW